MSVTSQIFDAVIYTLETRKSRCYSWGSQVEVCVKICQFFSSYQYDISIQEHSQIYHYIIFLPYEGGLIEGNHIHQLLFIYEFFPKKCINVSKLSSWEPFIYQIHDVISPINTKTKRRLKIQKFKYLNTDTSWTYIYIIFKHFSEFSK